MRSSDKLKAENLYYYNIYGHQIWKVTYHDNFSLINLQGLVVRSTYTRPINTKYSKVVGYCEGLPPQNSHNLCVHVRSWDKLKNHISTIKMPMVTRVVTFSKELQTIYLHEVMWQGKLINLYLHLQKTHGH